MNSFRHFLNTLFFQTFCVACEKPGEWICADCESEFPKVRYGYCQICGIPFENSKLVHPCFHCASRAPAYQKHRAPFYYAGPVEKIIKDFKYRSQFWVRQFYKASIQKIAPEFVNVDGIVPIPLHLKKLRLRGFNQSLLLARVWQQLLQKPVLQNTLVRLVETPAQVELGKIQRLKSLKAAFSVEDSGDIRGKTLLLVDDVHTTGSTLHTASEKLLEAGAKQVFATSFAIVKEQSSGGV